MAISLIILPGRQSESIGWPLRDSDADELQETSVVLLVGTI